MAAVSDPGRAAPQPEPALTLFELALDRRFNDVDVDLVSAEAAFAEAGDPHLAAAHAAIIATFHRQELRYTEAGEWFDRALDAAPPRSWSKGVALVLKAGLLAWQGRITESMQLVDDAEAFTPDELLHYVQLQRAYLLLAADRAEEARLVASTVQQGATERGDTDTWAIARLIRARVDLQQGHPITAEAVFRSVLVRGEVRERIRVMASAGLGMALARQGAMSAAMDRMELARPSFESWPRGAMEFGSTFATTYLDANLLELAAQTAERTVAAAVRWDEAIIHGTALLVQARVDIARGRCESARDRLTDVHQLLVAQGRDQLAEQARRLHASLDPNEPPEWITVEHFVEDPTTIRALLATAAAHPSVAARAWEIAAGGIDAPDLRVRAMARCAVVWLDLDTGRFDEARRDTEILLDDLRNLIDGIDALDVRAAGFDLVDLRAIAVAFAIAGHHDVLFDTLDAKEQSTFDFVLAESKVAPTLARLEQFRGSLSETAADELDATEVVDLDQRIAELRRSRPSHGAEKTSRPMAPRVAFVAANDRLYRVVGNTAESTFTDIGSANHVSSLIRRLRFAVAASSIDPLGAEQIDVAAAGLQRVLFAGLDLTDTDQVYSIRPGQHLIAVPWRLLPLGSAGRIALRIGSRRPRSERAGLPQKVLAVACTEQRGHAAVEAAAVAAHYPESTLLVGATATPDAFLAACASHDVVHISGYQALVQRERLVTTLRLDGGPLTMFDLGQVPTVAPIVVVASSRVNAVHSMTHDVNLALAQTLIARGAHAVIVSPIDLSPEVARIVLPELHRLLASGMTGAAALDELAFDDDERQRAANCLVCIEAEPTLPPVGRVG